MIKTVGRNIPTKPSQVLMINEERVRKPKHKGMYKRGKGTADVKDKIFALKTTSNKSKKYAKCYHYDDIGH